ncbi:MAG: hypothetical protein ACM3XZ_02680 [Betaproteobacteria bacterium]
MVEQIWRAFGGRKFLAFMAATVLCWFGRISGEAWVAAMGLYLAANVTQKAVAGKGGSAGG